MAARSRGLVSTLPGSLNTQRNAELPEYQPPQFMLDADAQRRLKNTILKLQFGNLNSDLEASILRLSNVAADSNDRVIEQQERLAKQRARAEKENGSSEQETQPDGQASTSGSGQTLEQEVSKLTDNMELAVRRLIDTQQELVMLKESLLSAESHAVTHATTQASLPSTSRPVQSSQRQMQHEDGEDDEDDEGEREEYEDIQPTAPVEGTQQIVGPSVVFREQLEQRKQRFNGQSLAQRYAGLNSYRNFRNLVHSARDPEGGDQDPSEWFSERPPARPGVTETGGEEGDLDEEDIQMTRAVTSTKCPITLQEFKEPLTSNSCPHTYEASAIREMIQRSNNRINTEQGPRTGVRAVQCPVQGCASMLTLSDLHEDMVIKRRIKRLQRNRELQEQETQDRSEALLIDDDDDQAGLDIDEIEDDEQLMPSKRVKREARSSMR